MYYKEGIGNLYYFPCLSVRLAIVYFLLFYISDADNPRQEQENIYPFIHKPFQGLYKQPLTTLHYKGNNNLSFEEI